MFSFFKKSKKVDGLLGYFNLSDWWLSEFSDNERAFILKTFQPLGSDSNSLIEGKLDFTSNTPVGLLGNLAMWFKKKEERSIGYRLLKRGEEFIPSTSVVDDHFFFQNKIEFFYRFRDDDDFAFQEAMNACKQQIAISKDVRTPLLKELLLDKLPGHGGFVQLAIIEEKQHNYQEAISICRQALAGGWNGDWENRIERLEKKLAKKK